MKRALILFSCLACFGSPVIAADAQVLLVGTFHFANPGADQHNVEAIDVLTDDAQRQIDAIVQGLAAFRPTDVFVEWPEKIADERYAAYRDGSAPVSRNEVVQLGFRLAATQDLARVHGIDVEGDFPFEPIGIWAAAYGKTGRLEATQAGVAASVQRIDELQREQGIAAALRHMNDKAVLDAGHAMYMDLLRYGGGDEQPGAALNSAWFDRNFRICARLLQQIGEGDRAVVFFGAGHIPWLERCIEDTPGVELVDTGRYLGDG